MSSSIPIPARTNSARSPSDGLAPAAEMPLGKSLPSRSAFTYHAAPTSRRASPPPLMSRDDLSVLTDNTDSNIPTIELVSRTARKWRSGRRTQPPTPTVAEAEEDASRVKLRRFRFPAEQWDFSEIVNASDQVQTAFERGSARAERPPRDGISGTYFIRRNESKSDVLCVFKPVDEEARSIEMSPTYAPVTPAFASDFGGEFSLGPSAVVPPASPPPPDSPPHLFHRVGSVSSDSDQESRTSRPGGFYPGEGAYKELAAYLLDRDRVAGVPQTALAICNFNSDLPEKNVQNGETNLSQSPGSTSDGSDLLYAEDMEFATEANGSDPEKKGHMRTKMGAFQVFVPNVGDADDFGPGVFDKDQVHRIAVLDMRALNYDRHGGNILVKKSTSPNRRYDLVPIDHGYILPDTIQCVPWPIWMDWPMIRQPLSEDMKNYIELLDADSEANLLTDELGGVLRPGSLQGLKIATSLLQKGVAAGLTLYEIGLLIYSRREEPHVKSELAKIVNEAQEAWRARERHMPRPKTPFTGMPEDHYHRRHQSMSSISTFADSREDDYVTRYAQKRIVEVVKRVAEEKDKAQMNGQRRLSRARSIPDFGIGVKPLHAILTRTNSNNAPAPTPASSPMYGRPAPANSLLEAQLPGMGAPAANRVEPIRVPINDRNVMRIAIPEPIPSTGIDVGHLQENASAPTENVDARAYTEGTSNGRLNGGLPPLYKGSQRKSSPVAPLDMATWGAGTP